MSDLGYLRKWRDIHFAAQHSLVSLATNSEN
jgi:hypothetical protein